MAHAYKALFLSHGGGPMPLLGDSGHREMVAILERIAAKLPKPDALVVVSAHWEEPVPTLTAGANPPLIYDYYGFPAESYEIQYPCPGSPALARRVHDLLGEAGMPAKLDETRGFDHGLFVPLKLMYPQADIPCIQLSLSHTLDPAQHLAMGRALQSLHADNILLIGSGFSFHNLRAFFQPLPREFEAANRAFESWLLQTCGSADYSEPERADLLLRWAEAPGARFCHPREEHLLPLHVCYGAAQGPCRESFELEILNKKASMYLW
jgi:4,5-DOPA dioxygenase extradiol